MADGGKKAGSFSDPSTVSSARPIYIIFRDIVELLRTPGGPNTLSAVTSTSVLGLFEKISVFSDLVSSSIESAATYTSATRSALLFNPLDRSYMRQAISLLRGERGSTSSAVFNDICEEFGEPPMPLKATDIVNGRLLGEIGRLLSDDSTSTLDPDDTTRSDTVGEVPSFPSSAPTEYPDASTSSEVGTLEDVTSLSSSTTTPTAYPDWSTRSEMGSSQEVSSLTSSDDED